MSSRQYNIWHVLHNGILYYISSASKKNITITDEEIKKTFFPANAIIRTEDVHYYVDAKNALYQIIQYVDNAESTYVILLHFTEETVPNYPTDPQDTLKYLMILLNTDNNILQDDYEMRISDLSITLKKMSVIRNTLDSYFNPYHELAKEMLKHPNA